MNRLISTELFNKKEGYNDIVVHETNVDNQKGLQQTALQEADSKSYNIENMKKKKDHFEPKDIGLTSPSSEAFFKLREDGTINLYSNPNTGITFNKDGSVNLLSNKLNINSKQINILCDEMGLKINDFVLNPLLYKLCANDLNKLEYRDLRVKVSVRKWNDNVEEPGWMREDIEFKPFFPTTKVDENKRIDDLIGWSLDK